MYQIPELHYVDAATNVVLGIDAIGGDAYGMIDELVQEFEKD